MGRPRKQTSRSSVYVATDSFVTNLEDGTPVAVVAGRDMFAEGHELIRRFPQNFRVAEGHSRPDVEQATAAPGEIRGA